VRLSLVIATRRRPRLLDETLTSVAACDPVPDEVIVVDGDEHGSAHAVAASHKARYVDGITGLPIQRNAGIDTATGDVVVFCDDDVELDPRVFGAIRRAFADPGVIAATGHVIEQTARRMGSAHSRLRRLTARRRRQGTFARHGFPRRIVDVDEPRDLEFVHGCLMAVRRDVAARVRLDERLAGYALAEDEDFGYRLSRHGRVRYVPDAVVLHKNTGYRTLGERRFNRMLVVNRAYLLRKNFAPGPLARAQFALMVLVLAVHRAVNREWGGVRGLAEGSIEVLRRAPR
jgi:GT2 family glycosyltransferase